MISFVLILGAPRSGSSCLSGCVYSCGVDLGRSLSSVKDKHNEKGYFESDAILRFNRSLFLDLGIKWDDRDLTPEEVTKTLVHKNRLIQILKGDYSDGVCSLKDFRLGIFSDLYQLVFKDMGIPIKVLIIRRNKQAVTASMRKMFGWEDSEKANWMYDRCYRLFDSYVCPQLNLQFEDLIANPIAIMTDVCQFMEVDFDTEKQRRVLDFVEKGLVHEGST